MKVIMMALLTIVKIISRREEHTEADENTSRKIYPRWTSDMGSIKVGDIN